MFAPIELAENLINSAHEKNPGRWREHSLNVAACAQLIASAIKTMNPAKAYSLGLLHDIGRINGVTDIKHTIDGYNYMMQNNYEENAVICLTHSFPVQNVLSYSGKLDCDEKEISFIQNFITNREYDEYDKLIQLCDALSSHDKFCVLEQRLIDVAIRHGINAYSIDKWKKTIDLKHYFDNKASIDVYKLIQIKIY